jgi:D-alanyl-D-alanine carboxypeptidase
MLDMKISFKSFAAAALSLLVFGTPGAHARTDAVPAPVIDIVALEQLIAAEMREKNIPGLALAITQNGKPLFVRGFGKANLEQDLPVTADSVFMVGSISKPMLAVGVMLLAEQGKLSLDDAVSKHVPGTPESWRGITLRHLLNHTSGIRRESPAFDGDKAVPDIDLITATFASPLDFPTGTKSQYCNICYFTLAEIIGRVSGQPWPQFMASRVFAPAGMSATRTTSPTALVPRRAASYAWREGAHTNIREYVALRPSGAFISSINDMVKWEAALYGNSILPATALAAMAVPGKLNDGSVAQFRGPGSGYGLGWAIDTIDGQTRVSHGGSLAGFRSEHARYPQSGVAIILLTNVGNARPDQIERKVAKLLWGK